MTTASEQLRRIIRESGETLKGIADATGVSHPILSRFLRYERDIRMETADKLLTYFRYELCKRPKRTSRR